MSDVAELFHSDSYSHRVAAEVRGHAARQGLQQKDLAKALNYGQPQISKRMRGQVPFTLEEIAVLAGLFEVEPAELMPAAEQVRRQGLEPRTRWFSAEIVVPDDISSLATVLPFSPARVRRSAQPRRIIRRAPRRTYTPILGQLAVSR
jgi:transcriptional regulator with XRE-family HTH domain